MADDAPHTLPSTSDPPSQPPRKQSNKPLGGFKRKRTGCMTCRKRKIKCCERKPTCLNCEKARRECTWVGGGDIFKHDQNPSVAEKRETKFYKASASAWTAEDQQRLTTPSTSTREYQFVSMNNEARESPQPHPPPNLAALHQPSPYAHMDLQALASAATYMPLPPTTYGDAASHGADAMIDPNLDGGDNTGQSTSNGIMGHGIMGHGIMEAAGGQLKDEEEFERRIARVLTAAGEADVQQTGEAGNRP